MMDAWERDPRFCRLRAELGNIGRALARKRWVPGFAGNMSVDISGIVGPASRSTKSRTSLAGRSFLVTVAGSHLSRIRRMPRRTLMAIRICGSGRLENLWPAHTRFQPTSELKAHLAIYAAVTAARAVIHVHAANLTTLAASPAGRRKARRLAAVIRAYPPGSRALACATSRTAAAHPVIIWQDHGVIAWGRTLPQTFVRIKNAELAAGRWLGRHRLAAMTHTE